MKPLHRRREQKARQKRREVYTSGTGSISLTKASSFFTTFNTVFVDVAREDQQHRRMLLRRMRYRGGRKARSAARRWLRRYGPGEALTVLVRSVLYSCIPDDGGEE
jgi:hypothetical protein